MNRRWRHWCGRSRPPGSRQGGRWRSHWILPHPSSDGTDQYRLGLERRVLDRDAMVGMLAGWVRSYPIASIEDPLAEDDAEGFSALTREVGAGAGGRGQLPGHRGGAGAEGGRRGGGELRADQAEPEGTLTETLAAWEAAKEVGYAGIVSAVRRDRGRDDRAPGGVGWGVGQLKVGSLARSERMAKWNEALRIEEALGARARFGGRLGRSSAGG